MFAVPVFQDISLIQLQILAHNVLQDVQPINVPLFQDLLVQSLVELVKILIKEVKVGLHQVFIPASYAQPLRDG